MKYILLLPLCLLLSFVRSFGQGDAVDLHGRQVIGRIDISGNQRARSRVILREMAMKVGDTISLDSTDALLQVNYQRIYNLQLFNEVQQVLTPIGGDSVVLAVDVKERWSIIPTGTLQFADRNFNTWWVDENHDLRRAMAGLTITDKNFRGNLESLAATVQVGYTQKLGLAYTIPYINKKQTSGIGISASVAQSRQTYYTTDLNKLVYVGDYSGPVMLRQTEVGINYIFRPAYASRHIWKLGYKDYHVRDTVLRLNPDYYRDGSNSARFMELSYRYEYNGTDNWNYSLEGYKIVANAVLRHGFEGINDQEYVQLEAGRYYKLAPLWYAAFTLRGRIMGPSPQPYYFRSGLGTQTDYVRGYEYYVTDGYNYGLLRFDLKRQLFKRTYTVPVRYFTAIPLRIYPKLFADAGYINDPQPGNSRLSNRLVYSAGVGVDVVTLYDIKIRLEYAINHLGQKGLYLHFNSE